MTMTIHNRTRTPERLYLLGYMFILAFLLFMFVLVGCSEKVTFLPGDQKEADGWKVGSCYAHTRSDPFETEEDIFRVENIRKGHSQYRWYLGRFYGYGPHLWVQENSWKPYYKEVACP